MTRAPLRQLGAHPNLVALHDFFETPLHGGLEQYAVINEFVSGRRNLLEYMSSKTDGSLPDGKGEMYVAERDEVARRALSILVQLLRALELLGLPDAHTWRDIETLVFITAPAPSVLIFLCNLHSIGR